MNGFTNGFIFSCLLFIAAVFIVATGGPDGSHGGCSALPSDPGTEDKLPITGNVDAPSGVQPQSMTLISLGRSSQISSDGSFSTRVYRDGVAVIAGMRQDGLFGLMSIIVCSPSLPITGPDVTVDAQTTAVSMIFLSPYLVTNDPAQAARILEIIRNDPKTADLAAIIEQVFNSPNPMGSSLLM